ncbi:MAG TPA: adenylyltransferase/cytidyltransferase family protein [Candidatus Paceibacterota bacterium]|jgi:D-beta-D-heptose 7-phosphate kinase/D-beta-D-heptose 1-phosphate adenosyltransferase|nr:adenylyltransferase/cytidyltransferase family protein [Candidatus Paceibacterota bacterium]
MEKKKIIVAVSGGFDPIHIGHVRMFERARALGDELVVILNNDNWLRKKKRHIFMPQEERKEIIESLRAVDRVIFTAHGPDPEDMSVSAELRFLKPDIFANGGDRVQDNTLELVACSEIGCKPIFSIGDGGKVQSSSWLLKKYVERVKDGRAKKRR